MTQCLPSISELDVFFFQNEVSRFEKKNLTGNDFPKKKNYTEVDKAIKGRGKKTVEGNK